MPGLEHVTAIMMRALDGGPQHLPDDVFVGTRERVLLGMKVHANTTSHARLVALEDTFPRTLAAIGHDQFNRHSRSYLEQPGVTALALIKIGQEFPRFLVRCGEAPPITELARFEWTWLSAYHAADASVLELADLSGIAPEAMMEVALRAHPAARLECFGSLPGVELPGAGADLVSAAAVLIARPESEVVVSCASHAMQAIFALLENSATIGNLWAEVCEPAGNSQVAQSDFMPALIALIQAGALVRTDG